MPNARLLIGGAGAAALAVRVTRSLHARWTVLPEGERDRIAPLAEDAKRRALDLRGAVDRPRAEEELRAADASLAAALVDSAEGDPEIDDLEVDRLKDELERELRRLAGGDVKASRSTT
ncbi:MAG: hypothetical protein H0U84_07080 [Thermoleophilaceae bacterium]|nr:hypothetical protein [Thermoleophilaceae bacterium]